MRKLVYAASALTMCAQFTLGHAPDHRLTQPPQNAIDTRLIDRALSWGDARVIMLGDSFAMPLWSRILPVFVGMQQTEIAAFTGAGTPGNRLADASPLASPSRSISAGGDGYGVLPDAEPAEHFALPVWGIGGYEISPALDTSNSKLAKFRIRNDLTEAVLGRPLVPPGSTLSVRPLYYAPADPARLFPTLELRANSETAVPINLASGAQGKRLLQQDPSVSFTPAPGQISAATANLRIILPQDEPSPVPTFFLDLPQGWQSSVTHTTQHVFLAGAVYTRIDCDSNRIPGLYISTLADNSWSYAGFGSDRAATSQTDKTFSTVQLAHWLDATTIDPDQPVVAVHYLAAELQTRNAAEQRIEAMIDQFNAAAASAGLPTPVHLLVMPHFHQIAQRTDDDTRQRFEWQRDAMFAIAQRRADTAAASIYDATNGILFNGLPDAVAWLTANGYDQYSAGGATYDATSGDAAGNLLDSNTLHPRDTAAAVCFADVLHTLITAGRGCSTADLAEPIGGLDVDDQLLFLQAFSGGDPTADIAPPWATLDIDDILGFLDRFAVGCE